MWVSGGVWEVVRQCLNRCSRVYPCVYTYCDIYVIYYARKRDSVCEDGCMKMYVGRCMKYYSNIGDTETTYCEMYVI